MKFICWICVDSAPICEEAKGETASEKPVTIFVCLKCTLNVLFALCIPTGSVVTKPCKAMRKKVSPQSTDKQTKPLCSFFSCLPRVVTKVTPTSKAETKLSWSWLKILSNPLSLCLLQSQAPLSNSNTANRIHKVTHKPENLNKPRHREKGKQTNSKLH